MWLRYVQWIMVGWYCTIAGSLIGMLKKPGKASFAVAPLWHMLALLVCFPVAAVLWVYEAVREKK
jgi:hypothetical protein